MARTKISEFSSTPASNTDIDSINIAEGCAPSGINDAIRELMAQLKDFQTGAVGDSFNGPVGTTTAAAGAFTTLSASGAVTLSGGTANGVAYLNGSKVVTSGSALTFDGTALRVKNNGSYNPFFAVVNASSTNDIASTLYDQGTDIWKFLNPSSYAGSGIDFCTGASNLTRYHIDTSGTSIWSVGGSEQMRLTSTGLGIGTSSPAAGAGSTKSLEASGPLLAGGAINAHQTSKGVLQYSSNETTIRSYGATAGSGQIVFNIGGGGGSADSEGMRLNNAGNLGLGVTPSAGGANANYRLFEIGLGGGGSLYSGGGQTLFCTNVAWSGGTANYKASSIAPLMYSQESGTHIWKIAPSGTAGNAITFTQAATLTAGGDFLVGTTTDSGSSSNIKKVVGGNFRSFGNSATIPASSTGTVLTLSSSVTGVYIVNANFGAQGNAIYGGMLIVVANNGSFRIVTNGGGSSSTLSLSGANVQITNAIGSPLDATASAIFIGN